MVPLSPEDQTKPWVTSRPPPPPADPLALATRVHEAVTSVQQALLWGFDVHACLTLAIDALLELSGSTWGAVAVVDAASPVEAPGVRLDVPRSARFAHLASDPEWLEAVAAELEGLVRQASATHSAATLTLSPTTSSSTALLGLDLDRIVALPVPGATSTRVVLLARCGEGYDHRLIAALEPLIRLQGQIEAWAGAVEARRAAERALTHERRRLELALAASDVGVIEFDPSTGALQWDARVWAMHGLEPREPWTLRDWSSLLHPDDVHRVLGALTACLGDVSPVQAQYRIVRVDGEVRHIRTHGRTFSDAERTRIVGVSVDVTDDVRLTQELAAERAHAEAATQAKSQFLATMSHEIRTPMNGVLGMLELLLRDHLPPAQRDRAETAHASAAGLLRILDDILDLSKLESRQVSIEAIPFQPARLVADTVALLWPRAAEKPLRLTQAVAADVPPWVCGDPMRVRQVLLNLVGNAVKFTAAGEVAVRASTVDDGSGCPRLRVEVRDTGEGIAPDVQRRLFQEFVQADSSTSRRFGGSGLGLAISRQLVELMGGRIGLLSTPGAGSTFWFEIPAPAIAAPATHAAVVDSEEGLPSLRILAVDDNVVNRRVAQAFLEAGGHVPTLAGSGAEALALMQRQTFDLVLMDVQMPEMDGLTCLRAIRASGGPMRDVPVLALTANAMAGDREHYLAAGFSEYVSKPMTLQTLLAAIGRVHRDGGVQPRVTRRPD